ncbi:MAG: hypothetical protein WCG93_15285 [Paludibacter sp.]
MGNYIPNNDLEFNNWQDSLVKNCDLNKVKWVIGAEDLANLVLLQSIWILAFDKTSNKQNRTVAEVQAKDEAADRYKAAIRPFVTENLSVNSNVSDSDRVLMGLTVKTGTRTPKPVPTSSPVASVDFSTRMQHTLNYYDENASRSKAKPEGVHGCEIFMKVDGAAPTEVSELNFVGTCTASPYKVTFDGAKGGKTVYYWLRWVNTRGECGPWSASVSAMIMG